ncbi:MAG: hypothetical protein RLZZ436_4222 [Planctomycetota bacterium]
MPMSNSFIDELQSNIDHWTTIMDAMVNRGVSPAQLRGIPTEQLELLYRDGLNLLSTAQFLQAKQSLSVLCSLEWNDARYWVALGVALQNLREYHRAILAYCRASLIEEDPRTAMRVAECWLRVGDVEECRTALNQVIEWADDDDAGRCLSAAAKEMLTKLPDPNPSKTSPSAGN